MLEAYIHNDTSFLAIMCNRTAFQFVFCNNFFYSEGQLRGFGEESGSGASRNDSNTIQPSVRKLVKTNEELYMYSTLRTD